MLSHKYKCIFVHIPKVAGQSIEHVFIDLHGLTWETRGPLLLRKNLEPSAGPRRLAHLTASEYVSCGHMTQKQFDSYFKFSFVRNPWSRLVSIYKYLGYYEVMPFKQFLQEEFRDDNAWEARLFVKAQYDYLYNDEGDQLVDYIGRFEELQSGFDYVCSRIGIPKTKLPYVNKTGAGGGMYEALKGMIKRVSPYHKRYDSHGHYTEYYDSESIALVSERYKKDIETFDYTFGA